MSPDVLAAVARLNRDARTGVLVDRDVIYRLKYRLIKAAIAEGAATMERTKVQGVCRYPGCGWGSEIDESDCDVCGGTGKVSLGFVVVTIGGVRWHVPDHVEPGKSWAKGAPLVDAGTWKPGEREEKRAPLEVLADLVVAEKALGVDGDYDLNLGLLGDTGHEHTEKPSNGPVFPANRRMGRINWHVSACGGCFTMPTANPAIRHPIIAEWIVLHRGALTYEPPPPPPYRHRRWR